MKPHVWLRVASVVLLLYGLGHMSGYPWTPVNGQAANAVVDAMRATRFDVAGANRSYFDFYVGFGLASGLAMLAEGVALWFLGGLARTDARRLRPVIATFAIAYVANAVICWMYFFWFTVAFGAAIVIALALAYASADRVSPAAGIGR